MCISRIMQGCMYIFASKSGLRGVHCHNSSYISIIVSIIVVRIYRTFIFLKVVDSSFPQCLCAVSQSREGLWNH